MAGQKQGSARVTLREIDLSQVGSTQVLPQGVPAAVVGTAKKVLPLYHKHLQICSSLQKPLVACLLVVVWITQIF